MSATIDINQIIYFAIVLVIIKTIFGLIKE